MCECFCRYGMAFGTMEALKTGRTTDGRAFCLRQTRKARRYTWESQTLHVGKSNATRGKVKCYTWESQTLHVGKSDASR